MHIQASQLNVAYYNVFSTSRVVGSGYGPILRKKKPRPDPTNSPGMCPVGVWEAFGLDPTKKPKDVI